MGLLVFECKGRIFFLDLQIWFICPKYLVVRNFLFFRALCSFNIFYL